MALISFVVLLLMVMNVLSSGNFEPLRGDQIWHVPNSAHSAHSIKQLLTSMMDNGTIDFLGESVDHVSFRVPVEYLDYTRVEFDGEGFPYTVEVEDLYDYLVSKEEEDRMYARTVTRADPPCISNTNCPKPFLQSYMKLSKITRYLNHVSSDPITKELVVLSKIGTTSVGHAIRMLKIKCQTNCTSGVKRVWIEGGTHAREWISPAITINIINNILNFNSPPQSNPLTDGIEYNIVPVTNPSGYLHTHNIKSGNRMWRKNRRAFTGTNYVGVDLNRNWGYEYGGIGSSSSKRSEVYRGPKAFSEKETQALRNQINQLTDLKLMISFHSFGQSVLYPWGYSKYAPIHSDTNAMELMGNEFAAAVKSKTGKIYSVGNSAKMLYPASGTADDWAKSKGVKYAFTIELRDEGNYGFVLPDSQIWPTVIEAWAGFVAMIDVLKQE